MANTILQVKRSAVTAIPASLSNGELAYSGNSTSNSLFIGHPDGATGVIRIAGGKYPFLHQASPGVLTVNAAVILDANGYNANVWTSGLFVSGSIASPAANSTAALITSISPQYTIGQLGATASGSNTELATTWAIKNYVDNKSAGGAVNTAAQFSWTNTHIFNANVTIVGNSTAQLLVGSTAANLVANSASIKLSANATDSVTVNATSLLTGNATVFSSISQTLVNTSSLAVGGQVTVNSTVTSFGTVANISAPSANLTVSSINTGNLNVTGTLTSIATQTLQVKDNFILVADGNGNVPTDAVDMGFYGVANTSSVVTYYGLGRVATGNYWTLFSTTTNPGATTLSGTSTSTLQAFLQPWGTGGAFVVNSTSVSITANSTVSSALAANTLSLTTALPATSGGTGTGVYAVGDILYASTTSALSKLPRGTDGQVFQMQGTTLAWGSLDGGTF